MNINLNSNIGISAQWNVEVCTPTCTGTISEYPYGTGFQNNAILNYFLSGIILHLHTAASPQYFAPSYFTDGALQLGTGIKPISYNDKALDKFYQQTSYIRPFANRINIEYVTGSGIVFFEKTYDFPSVPNVVKFTEAAFKQAGASSLWSRYGNPNPIYSRFLFTQETPFTGYINGVLNNNGTFSISDNEIEQISGVFAISGDRSGVQYVRQYQINPKQIRTEIITGFLSGYRNQFGTFSGFNSNGASGYYLSGQKYFFPPYNILSSQPINGYISGAMTELSGFIPYTSQEQASSGYYIDNAQYAFTGNFNEFSGLSGFENGYNYYGFNFLYGSGFVSEIPGESYGEGKLTGIIGARNLQVSSGNFNGFNNLDGFDSTLGYLFSKFFSGNSSGFIFQSGSPTFNGQLFGSGVMTGIIGYRNIFIKSHSGLSGVPTHEYGWYTIESGIFGKLGVNISGNTYSGINPNATGFSGSPYYIAELINGFISGSRNEFGIFTPLANTNNISGYIYNNKVVYFSTGSFSGFAGNQDFSGKITIFSGFFPNGFDFSGINNSPTGSGILSGYIGSALTEYISDTTGILTGIAGYKKYISGITLDRGQYIKIKYRIAFRAPQYAEASIVSGNGVLYGDFNGSGQLKLVGNKENIFGRLYENSTDENLNGTTELFSSFGLWWPAVGATRHRSLPNIGLSATMLKNTESLQNNPHFPQVDTRPIFETITGSPEQSEDGQTFMIDPWLQYPLKSYNTLYSEYTGGYDLYNLFVFKGDYPNNDIDIGGVWFSYTSFVYIGSRDEQRYLKPNSGNCGWLYKFNTPQRKWEDQGLYVTTKLTLERDQFFQDPYYGRYPQ